MPLEKTFNAAEAEPRLMQTWLDAGAFAAGANKSRDESFTIMLPPPNVTGALHVGHAFNHTLMDILTRWHRMRGFDTLWQPGQDHAGIATQLQVEKKLKAEQGIRRTDLTRADFLNHVWDWKTQYGGTIIEQMKRLGDSCDWDRNAFTMSGAPGAPEADADGNFHDAVIKVFVDMYEKGLIYRGKRLVNWDPHFETAISDLEVENIEVAGHMWHFKYPLADGVTYEYLEKDEEGNVIFRETRDYISIATTRPETMLGDGAVAVFTNDERYAPIVGKLCEIPVGPKEHRRLIPIITDEYPDPNFGSGAVKITGAHDFNDYQVAKRNDIPMYRLMDTRGAMRADGLPYAEAAKIAMDVAAGKRTLSEVEADTINLVPDHLRGLDRMEAREAVIREITEEGLAVMTEATDPRLGAAAVKSPVEPSEGGEMRTEEEQLVPLVESKPIMQPFGDRSKVVIEPMLTDQWFVDAEKVVGPALDAVRSGKIKIMPESGEKTYYHWLENIEPWCISRQLWWGHQIPVWYVPGEEDWYPICAATEAEAIEAAKARFVDGTEFRIVEDANEAAAVLAEALKHMDVADEGAIRTFDAPMQLPMFRDPDVLDTWFSSGLWPIGTLGWPEDTPEMQKYFPTDVLVTGSDILFFWVARMIMMQLAVVDEIPFHTVYLHQLVRDEKGKKMSKTTGNVIDPLEIINDYGADALRMNNAAMASIGGVLKMSVDRIAGYRNFGTKLWNAARFAEMNDAVGLGGTPAPNATLNKWIMGETAKVREVVDQALTDYRFNDAANALYAFVWGKVCDWYVEFSKPLFGSDDAAVAQETRETMSWVIDQCLILLHPIMPFITEELWGTLGARAKMLVHTNWPTYAAADMVDAEAEAEIDWVIGVIEGVRSARAQMHVPAGLYVPLLATQMGAAEQTAWDNNETLIKRLARIESLETVGEFPKGCVVVPVGGATLGMPLADIIDVAEEKARLEKTLGKLAKELGGLRGRLNNPKFAASAPAEVVEEARANLAAREADEAKIKDALARLAEIG
ncbi:valine--tRNA ligase [Tropicibacter naphthalenivorans]|uniref:Valine--tRNA ligase n=1 Tax=Tropicibacter naphthalenivorans TaxID=441103 RepID=A0A0P1GQ34_9RHOB|nr:valine--tRNA ligase [Tropicibacter naphthalenivorans]CUH76247.1 Valine--tRNA ligase [Tropicibacter naphthalenivorans]SMC39183.1 valyl-tRNA synthetase [Tropicibacter naphthalenivorans]